MGSGGGGGRFDGTALDDPAAVLAAVRSSISRVCKEQIAAEVKRLEPVLASGSASESTAALGAASLVLAEAAVVVAESEAVLRLLGLADDDATGWPSRRPYLEDHIKQSQRMVAGLERDTPERRRQVGCALLADMTFISGLASNFCRTPLPPAYRARPTSTLAVVDGLASGIDAVQVSVQK
ncbi:hypothetical protein ACQ4PT_002841 [Festuca glaucescens]